MLNVGTPELLVIFVVALLVLGPDKLPGAARQLGKAVGEIRRLSSGFQSEIRSAMREVEGTAPSADFPVWRGPAEGAGSESPVAAASAAPRRRTRPLRAE